MVWWFSFNIYSKSYSFDVIGDVYEMSNLSIGDGEIGRRGVGFF